jgi:lipoprotein-releasing system permease protein
MVPGRVAAVVVLVLAACDAKHPPPKQAAPAPTPTAGSAVDPWAATPGSAVDDPKWVHDPPAVLRDKINGVNAHVIVLKSQDTFPEYRDVLAVAEKTPGVLAAEPFIFSELELAKGSAAPLQVAVKAVDPARVDRVLTIGTHMTAGSLSALAAGDPPPIVLGDGLAHKLGAQLHDEVALTLPPDGSASARTKVFRVAGTFHMDFDEYDDRLALTALAPMQALLGRGDQAMGIEMTVNNLDDSDQIAIALERALGGEPYDTRDWYDLNKRLFTALYGDKRP